VGSGVHRPILSIAEEITSLMGADPKDIVKIDDRPGQVFRHTADSSKISSVLGWQQQKSWIDGLNDTIDWYRKSTEWWNKQLWMREIPIITTSGKRVLH
jgi:dTDP-glucose 4,6-dehydratase